MNPASPGLKVRVKRGEMRPMDARKELAKMAKASGGPSEMMRALASRTGRWLNNKASEKNPLITGTIQQS